LFALDDVPAGSVPPRPERDDGHRMLGVAGIRISQLQAADIDAVARLRTGRRRRPARRLVRERLRHLIGELIELVLRLRQDTVAHLQISPDLPGLDRALRYQVGRRAARRGERYGAGFILARISIPQRGRRQGTDIAK
jgi:hypothetical protein